VIAVPADCPRASAGDPEGNPVLVDQLAEAHCFEPGLGRDLCKRARRAAHVSSAPRASSVSWASPGRR
jgi:hypothetical protein